MIRTYVWLSTSRAFWHWTNCKSWENECNTFLYPIVLHCIVLAVSTWHFHYKNLVLWDTTSLKYLWSQTQNPHCHHTFSMASTHFHNWACQYIGYIAFWCTSQAPDMNLVSSYTALSGLNHLTKLTLVSFPPLNNERTGRPAPIEQTALKIEQWFQAENGKIK